MRRFHHFSSAPLLLLDNRIDFADLPLYLIRFRHIVLGLLYLLLAGAGQGALTLNGNVSGIPLSSQPEWIAGGIPGHLSEAILVQDRCSNPRPAECRPTGKSLLSTWIDSCLPPVPAPIENPAREFVPTKTEADHFFAFARAPPVRI